MCEAEFELLCETFRKSRVQVTVAREDTTVDELLTDQIRPFFEKLYKVEATLAESIGPLPACAVSEYRDALELCHLVFPLSLGREKNLVIIGPYAEEIFSSERIFEICERNGLVPKKRHAAEEFYASVPVLEESSALFVLLESFCERVWKGHFEWIRHQGNTWLFAATVKFSPEEKELDDVFLDMKNMEKRYEMENEIMNAVASGSEHRVSQLFSLFSEHSFEKRVADPIRNSKNYCIIMNTLLRKAAEQGGVHPIYLDAISSKFAIAIEGIGKDRQVGPLMEEMFRSYCKLVRKNTVGGYSPIVKKTVTAVDADPAADLSLHALAERLSVSKVYLSAIFKKETGKTLTQYIREKRMKHAADLLCNTRLQIQTVALHCGMVDVQYFSKLFKNYTGKTPTAFRRDGGKG